MRLKLIVATAAAALGSPAMVCAQAPSTLTSDQDRAQADEQASDERTIVVFAPRRGAVQLPVTILREISQQDIVAYGVNNLGELIQALEPETRLAGGTADDSPVILLNGSRIGSLSEVSGLPTEAVERIDLLSEVLATAYGYAPTRRVLNIVLRQRFRSATVQGDVGASTDGGRADVGSIGSLVRIRSDARTNFDFSLRTAEDLSEDERPLPGDPPGDRRSRTLVPSLKQIGVSGAVALPVWSRIATTVTAGYTTTESQSIIRSAAEYGLPLLNVLDSSLQATSPDRRTATATYRAGVTMSGDSGSWRWSAISSFDRSEEVTLDLGSTRSRSAVADQLGATRYVFQSGRVELQGSGPILTVPAGQLFASVNLQAGIETVLAQVDSRTVSSTHERLRRSLTADANLFIPIATSIAGGGLLGDLSANVGLTYRRFTDYGSLSTVQIGARWSPLPVATFIVGYTRDEGAPTLQQLGEPVLFTPDVPMQDFQTGNAANVTVVTGGNSSLGRNVRTESKVEVIIRPFAPSDFALSASYTEVILRNPVSIFPAPTVDVEAAFPLRFERDQAGRLIRIDTRPITVSASRFQGIRWGASHSGALRGGQQTAGRFVVSGYHTMRLQNLVILKEGGPSLDLLNGGALGAQNGLSRHLVELQANLFLPPAGVQLEARWQSSSSIRATSGTPIPGQTDFFFSPRATVNARAFLNLEALLPRQLGALRSIRLSLSVDNLFDVGPKARDSLGDEPYSYQRRFLDPIGRVARATLRVLL